MPKAKLNFTSGVTLLGASPDRSGSDAALALAPALICADGGANDLPEGRSPDAIIGDLDSLVDRAGWARRLGARLIEVEEQESTDLEKCLSRIDAPFILACGFLGGRIDHQLAALHALIAEPRPLILIGAEDVIVSAGRALRLELRTGDRIGLFPMRKVVAGPDAGLRWPLQRRTFEAGGRIGTSNEAAGAVRLTFDRPGVAALLPRARLDVALKGLLNRPASGPDGS
ncbi:MAG: thiamine pyrophosphokinase [Paracoccaceae bacterium]